MVQKILLEPPTSHTLLHVSPHCVQLTIKLSKTVRMICSLYLSYIVFEDSFCQIILSIHIQEFEYNCYAVTLQSTEKLGIIVSFCLPPEIPE